MKWSAPLILQAVLPIILEVKLPEDACLDSLDVMDAMLGKKGAKGRPHLIQQDNGRGNNYGYRAGKWKLQRHDSKKPRIFRSINC
jgi:hypothetical protein